VDEVLSRRLATVVDDETFERLVGFIEERIRTAIDSPDLEKNISEFISRRLDDLANTETPLGEMFTPDAIALLKEKASEQIAPVAHHLTEIAAAERTRSQIGALIKREVHDYYENLPFFKKIFVSRENLLGEVDDLVNESLPKRIEETLKGDFFAAEAGSFIDATIDNALARPLPEVLGKINPGQLDRLKTQVSTSIVKMLRGQEMQRSISAYVTDTLQRLRLRTRNPRAQRARKIRDRVVELRESHIRLVGRTGPLTQFIVLPLHLLEPQTDLAHPLREAANILSQIRDLDLRGVLGECGGRQSADRGECDDESRHDADAAEREPSLEAHVASF
jgi:hypothetical protein